MSITRNIIETAANMAADYAGKGVTVTPVADTPLADIRSQSRVSTAKEPQTYATLLGKTTEGVPVSVPKAVDAVQDQLDGYESKLLSARADVTAKYVEMIYPNVVQHLTFARNTVKPIVLSAIENFNTLYTAVQDPAADISIVRTYKPDLYKNSEFVDEVTAYEGKGYDKRRIASTTFNLPKVLQYQEIIDFLTSSLPSYKTEISSWLTRMGATDTEKLWNGIFNAAVSGKSEGMFIRDDYIVMDYLMCKAMRDNPPEGMPMSLAMWRGQMDDHIYAHGANLAMLVKLNAQTNSSGLLVTSGGSNTVVCVISDEYDRFLEMGGTDQMLKANAIATGKHVFHSKSIIADTERLTKVWNAYVSTKMTLRRADQVNIARKSAYSAVDALIATDYDKLFGWKDPKETTPQLGSEKVIQAKREFKALCEMITINTLAYMSDWFIKSICQVFYNDTAAYAILTGIDKADQENSNLEPTQAAAVATLEYICKYVADQLTAVKKV